MISGYGGLAQAKCSNRRRQGNSHLRPSFGSPRWALHEAGIAAWAPTRRIHPSINSSRPPRHQNLFVMDASGFNLEPLPEPPR